MKDVLRQFITKQVTALSESNENCVRVNLNIGHSEIALDAAILLPYCSKLGKKSPKGTEYSRNAIQVALQKMEESHSLGSVPVPTRPQSKPLIESIECKMDSLFFAGRYTKTSRECSQTEWIIGKRKLTEYSVAGVIETVLLPAHQAKECKFMSAGREDADVRMLREGRPFLIEIVDPKILHASASAEEINQVWNPVQVRDCKYVEGKSAMERLLEGESKKCKAYRCLVWTEKQIEEADAAKISALTEMEIAQWTPIRVLHRRPNINRTRTVHHMQMELLQPHFSVLYLETQAGTYIKEFVHSDCGRTVPSLASLLGCRCDLLELDVLRVDMQWP